MTFLVRRLLKRTTLITIALAVSCLASCTGTSQSSPFESRRNSSVEQAFEKKSSKVQVEGEGIVSRVLTDDTSGRTHQRFIVRLGSGQTVLIEHNTDLAPAVADLKAGDKISFSGEYIWNDQGGLIHWTHHDPEGRHQQGWLKHDGRTYQ